MAYKIKGIIPLREDITSNEEEELRRYLTWYKETSGHKYEYERIIDLLCLWVLKLNEELEIMKERKCEARKDFTNLMSLRKLVKEQAEEIKLLKGKKWKPTTSKK